MLPHLRPVAWGSTQEPHMEARRLEVALTEERPGFPIADQLQPTLIHRPHDPAPESKCEDVQQTRERAEQARCGPLVLFIAVQKQHPSGKVPSRLPIERPLVPQAVALKVIAEMEPRGEPQGS